MSSRRCCRDTTCCGWWQPRWDCATCPPIRAACCCVCRISSKPRIARAAARCSSSTKLNLSESALEELRMLSNIQVGNAAPFQSFLVGQPQFRRIISSNDLEQLRQRVIASYHLGPLNIAECGNYLKHRLKQVGWNGDPVFEQSAIEALHRHTGGIPRRINTLGNRLMMLGFLDELHIFTGQDVDRVA